MMRSPDGDTDFDIVAGVLQELTLASYLIMIRLHYVLGTFIDLMKENGFTLKRQVDDIPLKLLRMQTMKIT